ncbi:MAG TPA: enolase C-terminal domain-like protein [Casimicrobiaceae bacterium]|nr:enolase C-terminal domain-like protein [Casimicrobiaceae bacterium]
MKITAVKAIPFRAPRKNVWHAAFGVVAESEYAIVIIETDEGVRGVGEIATVWERRGVSQAADVDRIVSPLLIGRDPLELNALCIAVHRALGRDGNPAKAGVDIALHDLAGRILGVPVHQLLGGKLRDRMQLSFSINMGAAEAMAAEAAELCDQGFRTLKLKAGLCHLDDMRALEAIRVRIGQDVTLRIDMNAGVVSPKDAVCRIRDFEQFRPEFVEQPVKGHDIAGMAFVREHTTVPIMADESVWDSRDALAVVTQRAADLANIYVMEAGGLREARQAFAVFEAASIGTMLGSMPEFGIGTAAQLHLGAVAPNLLATNDLCGFMYHARDIVYASPVVRDGEVFVPSGPGLGVELDDEQLARWAI